MCQRDLIETSEGSTRSLGVWGGQARGSTGLCWLCACGASGAVQLGGSRPRGLPSQGQLSSPSPQAGEPSTSRLHHHHHHHHHHHCSLSTSLSSVALRHHRHSFPLLCFSIQTSVTPSGSRFRSFTRSLCCVPLINYPFSSLLLSHHHCFCLTAPSSAPPISSLASYVLLQRCLCCQIFLSNVAPKTNPRHYATLKSSVRYLRTRILLMVVGFANLPPTYIGSVAGPARASLGCSLPGLSTSCRHQPQLPLPHPRWPPLLARLALVDLLERARSPSSRRTKNGKGLRKTNLVH